MCKHVVLIPVKTVDSDLQKKSCQPTMFTRVWQAVRRALALEHTPPQQFACSQWQTGLTPNIAYLIYRWFLFLVLSSTAIASFVYQKLPHNYSGPVKEINYSKWFIYFTHWGFILLIVQSGLALVIVHKYRHKRCHLSIAAEEECRVISRRRRTPLLCKLYWVMNTIATDLAFVITLVYWVRVHDPKIHEVNFLNVMVHGINSGIVVLELAVTSHPVRFAHALYGVGAGLMFGAFSLIYWALGGTGRLGEPAIYPALDWSKPTTALGFVALCACVLVSSHAIATGLANLRTRIAARIHNKKNKEKYVMPIHH